MRWDGWFFLGVSWALILLIAAFCFWRIGRK